MNRHERRKARALKEGIAWGKGGDAPPGYYETAEAALVVARAFVASSPENRPRFAILDRDLYFPCSLLDQGHRFCRNAAAERLVDLWARMTRELGLEDGPTYAMLRAIIDMLDLPYDIVAVAELFPGAEFRTIPFNRPAGKA